MLCGFGDLGSFQGVVFRALLEYAVRVVFMVLL